MPKIITGYRWEGVHIGICHPGYPANDCRLLFTGLVGIIGEISVNQYPVRVIIDNSPRPYTPGYIGYNHYKFMDNLNKELGYIGASSAGYTINHYPIKKCSNDSCRVDCATAPDGFCCIDHSLTNRLLQTLQN